MSNYNLYNTSKEGTSDDDDRFNFISIDAEEFVRGDYKGINTTDGLTNKKEKFYSGDVEKDFTDAMKSLTNGLRTIFSSSIFNFLIDNDGDYIFDDENFTIKRV